MLRNGSVLGFKASLVLGIVVCAILVGGCPLIPSDGTGGTGTTPQLTVTPTTTGEPTVAKTINLAASATGGTEPYTFQWTLVDGPTVPLTDAATAAASFVPQVAGFYTFLVEATDSGATPRTGSAEIEVPVGDIQIIVKSYSDYYESSGVVVAGNPALIRAIGRASAVYAHTFVSVHDPEFATQASLVLADTAVDPRNTTEMPVTYEIISVPEAGRAQDATFTDAFGTITNNGQLISLLTIQASPEAAFLTLSNIGTTIENFGIVVPGEYVVRATVTNPKGVSRSRDLTINLIVEPSSISGDWGNSSYGVSAPPGPRAVQVKELPMGSPGPVTNKVLAPNGSAEMTVSVLPTTTTNYRFYLSDDNGVAHPEFVTQSVAAVEADGAAHDITLTIGAEGGMPTGKYTLMYETMDGYGNLSAGNQVQVNRVWIPGPALVGVPVVFHVTGDYLEATEINAALVGAASDDVDAPTTYEGWSGGPVTAAGEEYGPVSALADVNLDGALDIITVGGNEVRIKTDGYIQGSATALRHPVNNGNFGPQLAGAGDFQFGQGVVREPKQLAVGDLNGDGLPDIALSKTLGGIGYVRVYFHTGDPAQPYSQHDDQTLVIYPPTYEHVFRGPDGDLTSFPAVGSSPGLPGKGQFGTRIAIAPVFGGDDQPDLIITDPGFASMKVYGVATAVDGEPEVLANDFYNANEGRVYVFQGGADGVLKPQRPDIVTSEILQVGVTDDTPAVASTEALVETGVHYAAVYTGGDFDQIGYSLAANPNGLAVGSPLAWADGDPYTVYNLQIVDGARVADATMVVTAIGGRVRVYEFDTEDPENLAAGDVRVDLSAANADLPEAALAALMGAINGDADALVVATADPTDPEQLIFTSKFSALDNLARGSGYTQHYDGIAYVVAADAPSATLSNPILGTKNTSMGLGAEVAKGNINGTGGDDLLIAALDSGDDLGVNDGDEFIQANQDDGAVFFVWGGTTALVPITGVGADTALAPAAPNSTIQPTAVGARLGVYDVDGDGFDDAFFTEPGFDHIYMIRGAATPATTPSITFTGVTFDDNTDDEPEGNSLLNQGTFLFGDITGDTELDWLFLDSGINFGFVGFER